MTADAEGYQYVAIVCFLLHHMLRCLSFILNFCLIVFLKKSCLQSFHYLDIFNLTGGPSYFIFNKFNRFHNSIYYILTRARIVSNNITPT